MAAAAVSNYFDFTSTEFSGWFTAGTTSKLGWAQRVAAVHLLAACETEEQIAVVREVLLRDLYPDEFRADWCGALRPLMKAFVCKLEAREDWDVTLVSRIEALFKNVYYHGTNPHSMQNIQEKGFIAADKDKVIDSDDWDQIHEQGESYGINKILKRDQVYFSASPWHSASYSSRAPEWFYLRKTQIEDFTNTSIYQKYAPLFETEDRQICIVSARILMDVGNDEWNEENWELYFGGCGVNHHVADTSLIDPESLKFFVLGPAADWKTFSCA